MYMQWNTALAIEKNEILLFAKNGWTWRYYVK